MTRELLPATAHLERPSRWLRNRLDASPSLTAGRSILSGAASLASATTVTSLLGVVYWLVAARQFSVEAVGIAGAAISAMTLVATFTGLGLGTLLMGELPRSGNRGREMLTHTLIIVAVASILLGAYYAIVAPMFAAELDPLGTDALTVLLFAGGAAVTALGMVLDQALIGLVRGGLQLVRNVAMSVAKLAILGVVGVAVSDASGMAIYATWAAGVLLSLLLVAAAGRRRPLTTASDPPVRMLPDRAAIGSIARAAASHQSLNLGLRLPILLLPIFVVGWVSAAANSRFYIAWMIMNFAFVLPGALATVLYAASSADPASLPEKLRFSLKASAGLTVLATGFLVVLAEPMLSVFGPSYTGGATAMRVLALSGVALVVKNHYIAVVRANRRTIQAQKLVWAGSIVELLLAGGGAALGGLEGLCVGWALAVWLEALCMLPTVRRAVIRAD